MNQLLKWRHGGYQDATAFGPQAKASRQRARRVQSPEQKRATTSEQAQAAAERARADTAKAEAAKAKAEARKAKAEAEAAKANARTARAKEKAKAYSFFRGTFGGNTAKIHCRQRELLVKSLGMLGSDHPGERANAAVVVEKQRTQIGMTWDELIVPADDS